MRETSKNQATKALFIAAALILAISLVGSGIALLQRFQQTNIRRAEQIRINRAVCNAGAQERKAIRTLLIASDRTLGTPKAAGFAYYLRHPEELRLAHASNAHTLHTFLPPIACSALGVPYTPKG